MADEVLEIRGLTLHYGAAQALKGIDLTAQAGQITAVLGRNGVGKTSLMRGIVGRHPISGGQILWRGQRIDRMAPADRARAGIAFVPQGREVFPLLTVRENLETAFATLPRNIRRIPDAVFELFPVLKEMMHRRGGDLSGGQQQQLAIARAMVMQPRLLVLDEPTEGIQPSIIKDIGRAVRYLRDQADMAVVLVEQYFDFARDLADAFVVLDRGEVVMAGAAADMQGENEAGVRRWLTV